MQLLNLCRMCDHVMACVYFAGYENVCIDMQVYIFVYVTTHMLIHLSVHVYTC